jgi:hypothetical protein
MAKKTYTGLAAEEIAAKGYATGRTTRGSGCGNDPGDIVLDEYLIEHKATVHRSLSLKYEWLSKITRLASSRSRRAALQISFVTPEGHPISGDASWVMVPVSVFKELAGE